MKARLQLGAVLLAVLVCRGQPAREPPVGLVLEAGGARLLRAGDELPLSARDGDVLYAGDTLRSGAQPAAFLFCPEKASRRLAPQTEVQFGAQKIRLISGAIAESKPVSYCLLPELERTPAAGQFHYGGSMTRALKSGEPDVEARPPVDRVPAPERTAFQAQVADIDKAIAADPKDQAARVSRAALFEKFNLAAEALEEYRKIAEDWPDATWIGSRVFVHEKERGRVLPSVMTPRAGKVYALLVGISKYQRLPEAQWLRYADKDAQVLDAHLRSPRGGAVPDANIVLLINEKATTAAIKNSIETFLLARAGPADTVVILVAAHGVVEPAGRRGAYIITYDSDPEDLAATALPMADLQRLVREDLSRVGHVLVFVDVCRAGNIGAMRGGNAVNKVVEQLAEAEGDLFLFLASGPRELSFEGPQYGGGHGAFSYFLLDALNGAGDIDKDGVVVVGEIIEHVREKVVQGTNGKQHPRDLGSMAHSVTVAEMRRPGITLPKAASAEALLTASLTRGGGAAAPDIPRAPDPAALIRELDEAIAQSRILPDQPRSAFGILRGLQRQLTPDQYLLAQNKLRIALEDEGQQVLLRYLSGDQVPQKREDFLRGATYLEAAKLLTPESLFLEARRSFLDGRALLFEKDYRRAIDRLERAARIDPAGAYSYNALGIAYLEQADYDSAILGFRDATRKAPYWAYPLHNMALAYSQKGDFPAAIRCYQQAMRLAPRYYYLPYNLGLAYQQMNRRKDAEASFRKAMELAPESGDPYNALGSLYAHYGRAGPAEKLYRAALEKSPDLYAARHNLALLVAARPARVAEAVELWRENLAKAPDFLPSRVSLAKTLAQSGRVAEAIEQYTLVLKQQPDHASARKALDELRARK